MKEQVVATTEGEQIIKPPKVPNTKKRKGNLVEPLPRNQYPHYFSIWDGKGPSIEDIRVENPNLAHAVEISTDLVQQSIFDFNPEGGIIFDALVYHRRHFE